MLCQHIKGIDGEQWYTLCIADPLAVATPIRSPVQEPGPILTTTPLILRTVWQFFP